MKHIYLSTVCLIPILILLLGIRCGSRCADGADNDLDGYIDYPEDPGCWGFTANNEANHNYGCCEILDPPQCLNNYRHTNCGDNNFYPDTTCQDAGCVAPTIPVECEPSDPHVQLTYENAAQYFPSYHPNGDKIVYRSNEDGDIYYDIWIMDADGSNHVQLTTENYQQESPIFSPDGNSIVYISKEDGDYYYDIWVMDADGTNRVKLTTEDIDQLNPSYSPEGSTIVYGSSEDGDVHYDIWLIDCASGNDPKKCELLDDRIQITTEDFDQDFPSYHPNGDKIVYNSLEDGGDHMDIWIMNSDGSNHVQVSTEDHIQNRPGYSPDGSKIVYGSREDGGLNTDIWIMNADGSDHVQLTTNANTQRGSRFSPDGKKIVYRSREDMGSYMDVWIIECAGSATEPLPGDPYASASVMSTEFCSAFNVIALDAYIDFDLDDYILLEGEPDTCLVIIGDHWGRGDPVVDQCPTACTDYGCGVAEFYYSTDPPLVCGDITGM